MARVTVEDCVNIVPNRFELVLLAAQRARDIAAGVSLTVDRDNDKNTVVALREIAEQTIDFDQLRRHIAKGVNRYDDLNVEDDTLQALTNEAMHFMAAELGNDIAEIEFDSGEEDHTGEDNFGDENDFETEMDLAEGSEDVDIDLANDVDIDSDELTA